MEIDLSFENDIAIARICGRVDTIAALDFQGCLEGALTSGSRRVILDMKDMSYISSAGLRSVLILCRKARSSDVALIFCGMNDVVRKIFKVSGFSQFTKIADNVEEAKG